MTLKEFKKTRLGAYACKTFKGHFKTDEDVERYRVEIDALTHHGEYEAVYDYCMLENGEIDCDDVMEFLHAV